ncbi:hypothetical protein KP509_15G009800 [Ceratopteris richardii]|uniref:Uncharacterized protein n=1 Tax=Ceratopteris richardii TaxID=49495 RepID=A0A8T2T1R8_CERRI|nr:hypothetical protein KP509_15G009800 [Ceratopteris richardii]
MNDDDDDDDDMSSMIWRMFGYSLNKYYYMDDEDEDLMEADFHSIQTEGEQGIFVYFRSYTSKRSNTYI